MKYKVEGGVAMIGTDMVLRLTKEQAAARAHLLEKVSDGYRPKAIVQFKSGETIEINATPDSLPRPLAAVLVPQGQKATVSKAHAGRSRGKKPAAAAEGTQP